MKKSQRHSHNENKQMIKIVGSVVITIIICMAFYGCLIYLSRNEYLSEYKNRQQSETMLLVEGISLQKESDLITYLNKTYPSTGSKYVYVILENEVIFAQNEHTTSELGSWKNEEKFHQYLDGLDVLYTEEKVTVQDSQYTVGIVTEITYAYNSAEIIKTQVYLSMLVAFILLISGITVITLAGKLAHKVKKIREIQEELINRNVCLQNATDIVQQPNIMQSVDRNSEMKYDLSLIHTLLDKSLNKRLYPICFLYVRVIMKDIYYPKTQIVYTFQFLKSFFNKTQIFAEVGMGKFVAILYKTDCNGAIAIKESIEGVLRQQTSNELLPVEIVVRDTDDNGSLWEQFVKGNIL